MCGNSKTTTVSFSSEKSLENIVVIAHMGIAKVAMVSIGKEKLHPPLFPLVARGVYCVVYGTTVVR